MTKPSADIVRLAVDRFALPLFGIHGILHWMRVLETGVTLAEITGADIEVVRNFALLHDLGRRDDGIDPMHGKRSAQMVRNLKNELDLSEDQFMLLVEAIQHHNTARHHDSVTIQTCWDSDRLDIGRTGRIPQIEYLGTEIAKDPATIKWAYDRSVEENLQHKS